MAKDREAAWAAAVLGAAQAAEVLAVAEEEADSGAGEWAAREWFLLVAV